MSNPTKPEPMRKPTLLRSNRPDLDDNNNHDDDDGIKPEPDRIMASNWAAVREAIPHEERDVKVDMRPKRPDNKLFNVADVVLHASKAGILAHEVNQGAQCLNCGDKCSGLDLHFWRKICINCKCPPAAHEKWEGVAPKIGKVGGWRMSSVNPDNKDTSTTGGRRMHKIGKLSPNLIQHLQQEMSHRFGAPSKPSLDGKSFKGKPIAPYELASAELIKGEIIRAQRVVDVSAEIAFAWEPVGITEDKVVEFFNNVPAIQVPVIGTKGEQSYRLRLDSQMPAHDFDSGLCDDLSKTETEEFNALIELKKSKHHIGEVMSTEEPSTCQHCDEELPIASLGVKIMVTKQGYCYHPKCFVCTVCDDVLVGLKAFVTGKKLFCGRHFNDQFKARCAACDESIMETKYVKAEGRAWHSKHFCCSVCDKNLAGKRYVPIESMPHCVDCYYKTIGEEPKEMTSVKEEVEAPDEEIYLTVGFGGSRVNQDANSPSKAHTKKDASVKLKNASVKLKKAAQFVPADAPPSARRSDASIKKKPVGVTSGGPPRPKPNTASGDVVIRKHDPDMDVYEEMWSGSRQAPLKKANAVEPQFPVLNKRTSVAPTELPPRARRTSQQLTSTTSVAPPPLVDDESEETPPPKPQPFASKSPAPLPSDAPKRMPQSFRHFDPSKDAKNKSMKKPQSFT